MTALCVKYLGLRPYEETWQAMSSFTDERQQDTQDELWLLQHPPVFTQGQAGKPEHILNAGNIPVVQSDRGGQVTYHGPGQLIAYTLINLRRRHLGVRDMVSLLENAAINLLRGLAIDAFAKADAPGVYVEDVRAGEAKIASLGLRVRKGCCFHGLSLNVDMDLSPFQGINPCGYAQLPVTSIARQLSEQKVSFSQVEQSLGEEIANLLQAAIEADKHSSSP